jgi:hypothetical protein
MKAILSGSGLKETLILMKRIKLNAWVLKQLVLIAQLTEN